MSTLLAFALPLFLLWAAHAGFRLGKLGRGERRPTCFRFRLRNLLLFVTMMAVFFGIAQRLGAAKLFETITLVMLLVWFGILAVVFVDLCTGEPADGFDEG